MSFKIVIAFSGDQTYQPYFEGAALKWQSIIKAPFLTLTIYANVSPIDYVGGILASSGPTAGVIINGKVFPTVGIMTFDSYDLEWMRTTGTIERVILHEMGHVIGIGTIWNQFVKQTPLGPVFTGPESRKVYGYLLNQLPLDVPLENTGGQGTYGSHWRESVFDTELMTGYIDPTMPLSLLTVACLIDLGYLVDVTKSEPYNIPIVPPRSFVSLCKVKLLTLDSKDCLEHENKITVEEIKK